MGKQPNKTNENVVIRIVEAEVKPEVITALQQRRRNLLAQIAIRYASQQNEENRKVI